MNALIVIQNYDPENVVLYEAQHGNEIYVNEDVRTYLEQYATFKYWLSKNKYKRMFSEIESVVRKKDVDEPLQKKQRTFGGMKFKKTIHRKNKKVTKRKRR